ncbi:hypothetical protein ACFXDE_07300 [Kitasatospora sp. NPDC059408]|uniref:hypothetical protein n=1 Tax=Kitasatospora sp. NPDC059408 TaxID=3346823 RepID=UPI0036BE891E
MSLKKTVFAMAGCALLLALAQPAAADSSNHGPKTPQEAAACKSVTGSLLGGFGSMLGNAVCVVRPDNG